MVLKRAVLLMAVAIVAWGVGHPAIAQTGDKYTARLGWVPIANQNDRANF